MFGPSVSLNQAGVVKKWMLLWFLFLAGVAYFGKEVGGVYWRKLKLDEAIQQQLGFAGQIADDAIRQRVAAEIEELQLPAQARNFELVRTNQPRAMQVRIFYSETVNLLYAEKKIPVRLTIRRTF